MVTLRETEGRWDRYGETEKGLVTLRETERILDRYGEILDDFWIKIERLKEHGIDIERLDELWRD